MQGDALPIDARTRFELAGHVLDLSRMQLQSRDGQPVELRPQAFAVLRHLAINAGRVVTKEELFTAVWPNVVVTDDSLVQAIGDIRRALGPTAHSVIRTMPRRGYTLHADIPGPSEAPLSPTSPGPTAAAAAPNRSRRRTVAALGLMTCAAVASGFVVLTRSRREADRESLTITPTIAVLPFDSMSVDGKGPWIGEALGVGITSALARLSGLPVLWRKASPDPVHSRSGDIAVAIENHATHLLSGSVQSDAERVRATVQLTDAASGRVLWSERYERPLGELFALEDDIIMKTVVALQVRLVEGEQAVSRTHPNGNLRAWELATRGFVRFETAGPEPLAQARALFEQALALDPDYAWARAYLAATFFLEARFGFDRDPAALMQRAFDEANRAVQTDPALPEGHSALGGILLARHQYDDAVSAGRKAVSLGPNDAEIHAVLAQTLLAVGEWAEAVATSRKAVRLSSRHPSWYLVSQAYGLAFLGRYSEAITAGERMLSLAESPFNRRAALGAMAFAMVEAGRLDEARHMVAQMIPLSPPGRGAVAEGAHLLLKDTRNADRIANALRSAGMPD